MLRRVARPRVLIYVGALVVLSVALVASMALRTPLKVDVVSDRAVLARIVSGGQLENLYRLQIMNATEAPQRYRISASGLEGLTVAAEDRETEVDATQARWVPVRLRIPYGAATAGSHTVYFTVEAQGGVPARVVEKAAFQVPR